MSSSPRSNVLKRIVWLFFAVGLGFLLLLATITAAAQPLERSDGAISAPAAVELDADVAETADESSGPLAPSAPPTLTANFTATPTSGVRPLTVIFSDTTEGPRDAHFWTFGDGLTSTVRNPEHIYNSSGSFTVTLTVTRTDGETVSDTLTRTNYITVVEPTPALADFSADPVTGIAPLVVTFTNNSTGDFDSSSWDFGDGGSSMLENPVHIYTAGGFYTVTLDVSGKGGENSITKTNYISVYNPVVAGFIGAPVEGLAPLMVTFTNTSSGDFDTCDWDFGDLQTSSSCNTVVVNTYALTDTYTVSLTVSGLGGSDDERKTNYILVRDPIAPVANFEANPTSGAAPLEVSFSDLSTGDVDSCSWDFGDGGSSTDCNPIHTYVLTDSYTVSMTVHGPAGSDDERKVDYITVVDPIPIVADFSGSPLNGIAPLTVTFTNSSTGDFDTFAWDFGDGGNSTEENPSYSYTIPGTYTVTLSVSGKGTPDEETKTNYITVYEPVEAGFSGDPLSGIAPLTVTFTNESTGDFDTCAWDFGDGGNSSDCNDPSYQYTSGGVYTVSLTASGLGGSDTATETEYITIYDPVVADFSGDPVSGTVPLTVSFTNESTGDFSSFEWDFGDGGGSAQENPSHTYTQTGSYTVTLSISGDGGDDVISKTSYINVYDAVVAGFSGDPLVGIAPVTVTFTNTSIGDFDTCAWSFGDGGSSAECNDPSHQYTAGGVYTVSLTASGLGGSDTETKPEYITIYDSVTALFSGDPVSGTVPLTVSFTNESVGDFDSYDWDFGDGGNSTLKDPSHTYTQTGSYTVSLSAGGPGGEDTITKTGYINVYNAAIASFSGDPLDGIAPLLVTFTNTSIGDFDTCAWSFGDGGSSADCNDPSHEYTAGGIYTVSLTVSGLGGSDTETKTEYVTIYDPVAADFSGDPVNGVLPQIVDFTNNSTGDFDTCSWSFGDGNSSSDCNNPSNTYTTTGTFTVSLAISGLGGSDAVTKTNYISVREPVAVAAAFSADPISGTAPLLVNFTNESTGDFDSCSWTFGDGGSSDVCNNPSHTYTAAGFYTVILTVQGKGGIDTETKVAYISVYDAAVAAFSGSPTSGIAPLRVVFINESTGDFDTCAWDFGDGGSSDDCVAPSHDYITHGIYTVSLTVTGLGGADTETKVSYIMVFGDVMADFSANPVRGFAPLMVTFSNLSVGNFDTCTWTFGDGGSSNDCTNPSHVYALPGRYTVSLTASGTGGTDAETKTDYITVYEVESYLPIILKDS